MTALLRGLNQRQSKAILMVDVNSNMAALSRGFKPRKAKLAKANSEVLVYTPKQKINLKPLRRNLLNCA